jgi:hypothetical protein
MRGISAAKGSQLGKALGGVGSIAAKALSGGK